MAASLVGVQRGGAVGAVLVGGGDGGSCAQIIWYVWVPRFLLATGATVVGMGWFIRFRIRSATIRITIRSINDEASKVVATISGREIGMARAPGK